MPQLDPLILSTQTAFVFFFWLGYFIFIKTILPVVSMEMKLRNKRILNLMLWFKENLPKTLFFRLPFSKLFIKTRGMLNSIDIIINKKKVFFGIYSIDLYYLKNQNKIKLK
jgi:hypothetical protein